MRSAFSASGGILIFKAFPSAGSLHEKYINIIAYVLLDSVRIIDYILYMKSTEFKRWLAGQGATFKAGKVPT